MCFPAARRADSGHHISFMVLGLSPTLQDIWKSARRYPRISLTIPVEVRFGNVTTLTSSLNVSAGGMLLQPQTQPLPLGTELRLRFNLPTGHSISATGKVVHLTTTARVVQMMGTATGVRFTNLDEVSRMALSRFLQRMITYVRRGVRITRRMHVTIRPAGSPESLSEMAETIVISRHGGLLSTRARFAVDDEIILWWHDGKRGTSARIVHRHPSGTAGLTELGFEFLQDFNFWGLDFPEQEQL